MPVFQVGYLGRLIAQVLAIGCGIGLIVTVICMAVIETWEFLWLLAVLACAGTYLLYGFQFNKRIGDEPHPLPRGWLARQLRKMPKQLPLDSLLVSDAKRGGFDAR